jgi:hypothetical protein
VEGTLESLGVAAADIKHLTEWIDGGVLLEQRRNFDAGRYQQAPAKRKRESPFSSAVEFVYM